MAALSSLVEIDLQLINASTKEPVSDIIEIDTEITPRSLPAGDSIEFDEPIVLSTSCNCVAAVAVNFHRPGNGTHLSFVTVNTYHVERGGSLSLTALTMSGGVL